MDAIQVYGRLNKQLNNNGYGFQVMGHKDYGRGCLLLVQHFETKYTKGTIKVHKYISIEVHEYDSEGFIDLIYNMVLEHNNKSKALKAFENAMVDVDGIAIE